MCGRCIASVYSVMVILLCLVLVQCNEAYCVMLVSTAMIWALV